MKPEKIIKRVKEEFFLNHDFDFQIMEDCVAFPLYGFDAFTSRAIARCCFRYWSITSNCLYVYYKNL